MWKGHVCLYSPSKCSQSGPTPEQRLPESSLIDLAFTFSPLVEQTTADTVVLNIDGCGLLLGHKLTRGSRHPEIVSVRHSANVIMQHAAMLT